MKRYLRLYWLFIRYSLIRTTTYKEDFIVWSLISIGWTVLLVVFYEILFLNVDTIAGWNKSQVLLIQGFYFLIEFVMWGVLWENMRQIPEKINLGTMDLELLKPVNSQFLISFKSFSFDNVNNFVLGLVTIGYALKVGGIQVNLTGVLLSAWAYVIACVYIYAAWFSTMCVAFWFDRFDNLHHLFPSLRHFWKVPLPFFQGLFRKILAFVIPVGLITTVPVEFLLGRSPVMLMIVLFIFALGTLVFSSWFFKIAIKHYSSASS